MSRWARLMAQNGLLTYCSARRALILADSFNGQYNGRQARDDEVQVEAESGSMIKLANLEINFFARSPSGSRINELLRKGQCSNQIGHAN